VDFSPTNLPSVLIKLICVAVLELTERYEGLASELEVTLQAHGGLELLQRQLAAELQVRPLMSQCPKY
jgi:hypothetical protein